MQSQKSKYKFNRFNEEYIKCNSDKKYRMCEIICE